MLKKGDRVTGKKLRQMQKRYKNVAPVYEKQNLSTFEEYVSNAFYALVKTVEKVDLNKELIEMLVFLYQCEFFEKRWVYENYNAMYMRKEAYGIKAAKNRLNRLIREGYVELYKHRQVEYETFERGDGFWRMEEVEANDVYTLSTEGLRVVREYFKQITGETLPRLDKSKNKLIYKGENPWDRIDYSEFNF